MAQLSHGIAGWRILGALALCMAALTAHADTIYKSTAADGAVTYSAVPVPGASKSEAIDIRGLSPEQRRAARILRLESQTDRRQANADAKALEEQWQGVDKEISSAQTGLKQAEDALRRGRVPEPGERRGMRGGGSRLDGAYFERIHALELAVARAKKRLDQAYEARNAIR